MPKNTINFRITPEFAEVLDLIGEQLHEEGVYGLIYGGKINRSAVIKYLVEREYLRRGGELPKVRRERQTVEQQKED